MKHKYKGLVVESINRVDSFVWFIGEEEVFKDAAPITPVFNRDGVYTFKSQCWTEYKGKAYKTSGCSHDDVMLHLHKPMRECEAAAADLLIRNKVAGKELKKLRYLDKEWKSIRATYRDTKLCMFKLDKEYKNE